MGAAYTVLIGDCRETLRSLPDRSVNCCVTSPPYFGLRDYGAEGQIGLEETPEAFVAQMVDVFREVRRVLRDDGTLWLNLGDSYASAPGQASRGGAPSSSSTLEGNGHRGGGPKLAKLPRVGRTGNKGNRAADTERRPFDPMLKPKDLVGIPWRVAFALQADGWYLRQDIIWSKPNPMPESVTDRCTKAHEYLFLLSKSARYYFDAEAMKEPSVDPKKSAKRYESAFGGAKNEHLLASDQVHTRPIGTREFDGKRNRRSVWTVTTKPFAGAHFATFPPDLIEPCILAGCPPGGTVLDPFGGSGTTAGVAIRNGRSAILCELNPDYAALVDARVLQIAGETPDMFREAAE